jgi:DnaJ-class molecular chaperone
MDLKVEDLFVKCTKCNGTGWYKEVSGARGGFGGTRTNEGTCPDCGGAGGRLTESGEAIAEVMRFMKRRGQI